MKVKARGDHALHPAVAGGADPGICDIESGTAGVSAPGYNGDGASRG
jgi:hypothetical protein